MDDQTIAYWPGTNELTKPAKEVAKILNVHYNTLFRWIKSGKIDCVRFSRSSIHFTCNQVNDFIESRKRRVKIRRDVYGDTEKKEI